MRPTRAALSVLFALALSMALALSVLAVPALADVSDVPDDTPQTDGVVFAVLPVGDRIYIGGDFTSVDGVPRARLAAIDANTGALTDWNPGADRRVAALAASPDGARIYAGGDFGTVGGAARTRVAAIDASSGAVQGWRTTANGTVRAIATLNDRVYLGGSFTSVRGQPRSRLAAVSATTGTPDPSWTPAADNRVRSLALSPDNGRLYAGGDFATVSGRSLPRLAALDTSSGAVQPWAPSLAPNGPVFAIAAAGGRVFVADGGAGNAASAYDAGTGLRAWRLRGDGDGQAIAVLDGEVYVGGHFVNFAGQVRPFFAAINANTGTLDAQWTPSGGGGRLSTAYTTGVWALLGDPLRNRLYAGTNFSTVSGEPHRGFVQFSAIP